MKLFQRMLRSKFRAERGQAMVLVAAGMIGVVGFIGLAVDAGIVFSHIGHLRRGVDAAALSAANQIREGIDIDDIRNSAKEQILLNLPETNLGLDVIVDTCISDPTIDGCNDGFARKLARVEANLHVELSFMPILGFGEIVLNADAISETAAVDLVLVLDNSTSMAYDTAGIADPGVTITDAELAACNTVGDCMPFEDVRTAAHSLVDRMYMTYDRVALVNFSRFAGTVTGTVGESDEAPTHDADLSLSSNETTIDNAIDAMEVYPNLDSTAICPDWQYRTNSTPDDPRGCMRTNPAAGLAVAGNELQTNGRDDAIWVVVLLSDGVANAAYQIPGDFSALAAGAVNWYCPTDYYRDDQGEPADIPGHRVADFYESPWCTDGDPYNGYSHPTLPGDPDPEDMAMLYADWVACYPLGLNNDCSTDGLGAVVFAIGLGDSVINLHGGVGVQYIDVGEQLLRYVARVGYDGNPASDSNSDPCFGVATSVACGNYYYSPDGTDLTVIFNEIADRIFTRLVH
jgi:hypothetical protein